MYKVISGGVVVGYSDTVVYIRANENGSYVPCEQEQAGGFCAKIAESYFDEETEVSGMTLIDRVYQFEKGSLFGNEPVGTVENENGALLLAEAEEVVNILIGGMPV